MYLKDAGFSTKSIHIRHRLPSDIKTIVTPIYQTSTFLFNSVEEGAELFAGKKEGYIYTRLGNPTQTVLEDKIAILEEGEAALATASGMAAIATTIFTLCRTGDHIVADETLYGCTHTLFSHILTERLGIEVTFIDASDLNNLKAAIRGNTKLIYFETPANPTLKLIDIRGCVEVAKKWGIKVVVDNTFMTPYLQNPLKLGVDVVVHSATKYLCGHGDTIAGVIIGDKEFIKRARLEVLKDTGGIISPFNSLFILRGLTTLALRMEKHCENAMAVAQLLEGHPKIEKVIYPGLPSHRQHQLAKEQARGFGGMVTFVVKGGLESAIKLMNSVQLCVLAVSLGNVETLIEHPATMTHAHVSEEERLAAGITDGLIRLSLGIEDLKDIIRDMEQALEKC